MYTENCPGKINLFLEVHDLRNDGYHNIGSVFQTIHYSDRLSAEESEDIGLTGGEEICEDIKENLIIKAAVKLQKACNISRGISFHLVKKLPLGAGLGGGSSNAASALILCNKLWNLNLSSSSLIKIAASIGADVPFFLHKGCCFGEGIGEKLSPAPSPYDFFVVIGTPNCFVSTSSAYNSLLSNRSVKYNTFKHNYIKYHKNPTFFKNLKNDFEEVIFEKYEEISQLNKVISSFKPIKSMLCGSGASIFGLFENHESAQACEKGIRNLCRFSCLTGFQ